MIWLIVLILLVVLLAGATPVWPYSRAWGYSPAGLLAAVIVVLLILWLLGVITIGGHTASTVIGTPTS